MTTPRIKKTKLMRSVEEKQGRPLENLVPDLVNQLGMSRAATQLGVSPATLGYWMLKMGIQYRRVALADGETIEVRRQGKAQRRQASHSRISRHEGDKVDSPSPPSSTGSASSMPGHGGMVTHRNRKGPPG